MDAIVNKNINFTNTSNLYGESLDRFEWDFGDGTTDTSNWDTTHSYSNPGTYTVKLTVYTCGQCTPQTEEINIYEEGDDIVGGIDPLMILAACAIVGAVVMTQR